MIRPQEVVASPQALNQAFQNYSSAVSAFNRAQFELYRAMGSPAQWLTSLQKPLVPLGTGASTPDLGATGRRARCRPLISTRPPRPCPGR